MESRSISWKYDVFLSFRGEDTRKSFVDHLYAALSNAGINAYRDDELLSRGSQIGHELMTAIEESRIAVIVFSKSYTDSSWCLDELQKIMDFRNSNDRFKVLPVFYDVEPSEVRKRKLDNKFDNYSQDKIDLWRKALMDACSLSGLALPDDDSNRHETVFIQKIVKQVGTILSQTSLRVTSYTVGIDSRLKDIDLWVKDPAAPGFGIIYGMGGIGKTTLAKVVYNMNCSTFESCCYLENIRDASQQQNGLLHLQTQLLSDILKGGGGKHRNIHNTHEGILNITQVLSRKRVLLVLDDVDQIDQIRSLVGSWDHFSNGTKIILTTRNRLPIPVNHATFSIKPLDFQESLQLFSLHAFKQDRPVEGYRELSERFAQHCQGLPLTLQVMGSSLLGKKPDFWEYALAKLEEVPDERLLKTLQLTYKSLNDQDKRLFLTIASSFVGHDKYDAVKLLDKTGFSSSIGIQNLMQKSLITVDKDNRLVMHHLVLDMARSVARQHNSDNDTATTEGSLLFEDESMPQNKERPSFFKRLWVGF